MVWVLVTRVLTFIVVGFKTTSTKIAGTKKTGETGDDFIMLLVVQEDELFVLTRTKGVDAVAACFVNDE